ncbi:hypothetical protein B4W75_12590, partial [Staphylococcus intermedius]
VGLFRSTDFRRAMKLVICWSVKEILPVKMIISYIFSDFATEPQSTHCYTHNLFTASFYLFLGRGGDLVLYL